MKTEKETETIYAKSRQEWREWLQDNHDKKQSVWLIYYKKKSAIPSVVYSDAVDEALCFGWIDSKAKPINLCRSDKRNILQWLVLAKRPETRAKRIREIVELADNKQKPKQFIKKYHK